MYTIIKTQLLIFPPIIDYIITCKSLEFDAIATGDSDGYQKIAFTLCGEPAKLAFKTIFHGQIIRMRFVYSTGFYLELKVLVKTVSIKDYEDKGEITFTGYIMEMRRENCTPETYRISL